MVEEIPVQPHRRNGDFVSYRDMVDYFARQEADFHSMRAEGLMSINNQMEKIEVRAEKAADRIELVIDEIKQSLMDQVKGIKEEFAKHEEWHRNVLQGIIDRSTQNRISATAIVISIIAIILSTTLAVVTILLKH